jgi:hypothetical protein
MRNSNNPSNRTFLSSIKPLIPHTVVSWIRRKKGKEEKRNRFIRNLRDSDSFLVGHPKSGNTWTAYMLGIVAARDYGNKITFANIGDYVPTIHGCDFAIDKHEQLASPRIFRNEEPLYPDLYPKTIYLLRDPRAVLLSYYHHCVHDTCNKNWTIDSFVDEMLTNGCIKSLEPNLVRWDVQVQDWLNRSVSQKVLLVRYEDIKNDQRNSLIKMAKFLGISYDESIIELAVQRTSFSSMRKEEEVSGSESYKGEKGVKGFFVRKGKVDSWKEEIPGNVIDKIESAYKPIMKKLGYPT